MKTVRQQLQHISFNLSARQMRCHTRTQARERAQAQTHIMNRLKHTHTHAQEGEDTADCAAHQTTWNHGQQRTQHTRNPTTHWSVHNWALMQDATLCSDKTRSYKHTQGDAPGGSGWHRQQSCLQMGHTAGRHCDISEKDGFRLTSVVLQA